MKKKRPGPKPDAEFIILKLHHGPFGPINKNYNLRWWPEHNKTIVNLTDCGALMVFAKNPHGQDWWFQRAATCIDLTTFSIKD